MVNCAHLRPGVSALGTLGRRGLLSPWRVVLLLVPLLPGPGGKLLAPWNTILSVHLADQVEQRCCQGHADGLLFVPEHPTQSPLSPARWSPAGLLPFWSRKTKQLTTQTCLSLAEPIRVIPFDRRKISGFAVIHHGVCRLRPVRLSSKVTSELFASFGWIPY